MEDHGRSDIMKLKNEIRQKLATKLGDPENPQPINKIIERLEASLILIDEGEEVIVVPPIKGELTVKFYLNTLEFIGVENWPYAKEHGEMITWQ